MLNGDFKSMFEMWLFVRLGLLHWRLLLIIDFNLGRVNPCQAYMAALIMNE